jgi:hypothetical protein
MIKVVLLLIGFSFLLDSSIAQGKLARIKERGGFLLIHKSRGGDSNVIDSIRTDEIFYCISDESDWVKVHRQGADYIGEFDGYVRRREIEYFEDISAQEKQLLFQKIFIGRKELALRASEAYLRNEPISKEDQKEFDKGILSNYALLVLKFSTYFCKARDEETILIFLETLYADSNSANEAPLFEIGACYICEPNIVLERISKSSRVRKNKTCIVRLSGA